MSGSAVRTCRGHYDVVYAMPSTPRAAALGKLFGGAPACIMRRRVKVLRHAKYAARWLPRPLAAVAGTMACQRRTAAWLAEGFSERNHHPVFMAWLNTSLPAPASGELHITELDDDG